MRGRSKPHPSTLLRQVLPNRLANDHGLSSGAGRCRCIHISLQPEKSYKWRNRRLACSRKLDDVQRIQYWVLTLPSLPNHLLSLTLHGRFNGTATFTDFAPAEDKFSKELIAYWLSFVRTGNPNTHRQPGSPNWPTYTPQNRARIVLTQAPEGAQSGSTVEKEAEKEVERCKLVVSQVDRQQN